MTLENGCTCGVGGFVTVTRGGRVDVQRDTFATLDDTSVTVSTFESEKKGNEHRTGVATRA